MPKVSVIVPTYCSGEGLDRVMASLDAQTMPAAEFETVFVDDGSPDDTFARLEKLAAARPNMRVTAIPNSGWPSRPRNVGVEIASGEFVVFMDHDDELFPGALEAAYDFAVAHDLDVVNGKEIRTTRRFFAWPAYQRDVHSPDGKHPLRIMPMTPHKLYRRSFLLDHGIRFREGRRVQWEDIYFNIDVYSHTDRLGVLASQPFYHWVTGSGTNSSASYAATPDNFLDHLASVYEHIEASPLDEASAAYMKAHHYGHRILHAMVGPGLVGRDEDYNRAVLARVPSFVERYVPVAADRSLPGADRTRSGVLRGGRLELLPELAAHDRSIRPVAQAAAVRLDDAGRLVLETEVRWLHGDSELGFPTRDGVLLRPAPASVLAVLGREHLDVTDEVRSATATHFVIARKDRVAWPLPTETAVELVEDGEVTHVVTRSTTVLDVASAALGHSLADGTWTVGVGADLIGFQGHPWVSFDGTPKTSIQGGTTVTARPRKSDRLVIDVGRPRKRLFRLTQPAPARATVRRTGLRAHLVRIPVARVAATEDGRSRVRVRLSDPATGKPVAGVTGHLAIGPAGAALEFPVKLPAGEYAVSVRSGKGAATWSVPARIRVSALGRCTVAVDRGRAPGGGKRVWGRTRKARPRTSS